MVKELLHLPFLPLLPILPLRALPRPSLSPIYLPFIYWPVVSLGILSGSQQGSSSYYPPFDLVYLCLSVCASYFTMVPPCHLFLVPLSFPWWASLGILSGSSLFSPFSSLFIPFLPSSPSSHLVSHCHFVLVLSFTLASHCALSPFSPFCGQPGHTVRLVTPLSILRPIFSSSASLSFLPSFISFPFLKVFAQSGFAQRGNTL